jgi:hypothetical protein
VLCLHLCSSSPAELLHTIAEQGFGYDCS